MQTSMLYMLKHLEMGMSFETFKESKQAGVIAALLSSPSIVAHMEELSRKGKPAVGAIDAALDETLELTNIERQYVGRWVRDTLAPLGWRPTRQRRLREGKIFSSGAVYARRESDATSSLAGVPTELLPASDRIARARDLIKAFSTNDYGVDDYLRDKYAEAEREIRG